MIRKISRFRAWVRKHQKYAPVLFFICGFIWDSLTLGRIDRLYDRIVLCTYLSSLSVSLYLYNLADDGKWKNTFVERFEEYLPLAIQFFLGGLCSAYVIYFSRSVSFSKTVSFFIILVVLLFANELLKKRISNKYLQFSAYFFVNFTFFTFFIPVLIKSMNTFVFILSGLLSLASTVALIIYIYGESPSTRREIHRGKMLGMIAGIYILINTFYYFNLIPPVPLALDTGVVAHNIEKQEGEYLVTYERSPWYNFWRENRFEIEYKPGTNIYIFTSIFAPSDLNKTVAHRWKWYSPHTENWEVIDDINFEIAGGRDEGFRGYTYKGNMMDGLWEVDVITEEGLVLGIIKFEVHTDSTSSFNPRRMVTRSF
jgi:ABC-type multidrug transport system fused ATPase/permease subunit